MASRFLVLILFVLAVVTSSALTVLYLDGSSPAGSADKDSVKKVLIELIDEDPEIIVSSLRKAQLKRAKEEERKAASAVKQLQGDLENDVVIAGNPKGDVTLTIFHDYNCGYCRKVIPDIQKVIDGDKNLKVVLKDFAILGPLSEEKAKASQAVKFVAPGKWFDFYLELSRKSPRNIDQILQIAEGLGISVDKIKSEMKADTVKNAISDTRSIASKLGIRGTPAFVVRDRLIRGAVGYSEFQNAIAEARGES